MSMIKNIPENVPHIRDARLYSHASNLKSVVRISIFNKPAFPWKPRERGNTAVKHVFQRYRKFFDVFLPKNN